MPLLVLDDGLVLEAELLDSVLVHESLKLLIASELHEQIPYSILFRLRSFHNPELLLIEEHVLVRSCRDVVAALLADAGAEPHEGQHRLLLLAAQADRIRITLSFFHLALLNSLLSNLRPLVPLNGSHEIQWQFNAISDIINMFNGSQVRADESKQYIEKFAI